MKQTLWRAFLARLPLPMLAIAASYGVYSFALLFVPPWVAIVQAAAFECTYIGLAVAQELNHDQRRRATLISVGAVVTSVLYNTLAGLFHRNPLWLVDLGWWEWGLAVLHGAPLAWVAYLVADLLLHTPMPAMPQPAPATMQLARIDAVPEQVHYAPPVPIKEDAPDARLDSINATLQVCPKCGIELDAARWRAARRWGHCKACK